MYVDLKSIEGKFSEQRYRYGSYSKVSYIHYLKK